MAAAGITELPLYHEDRACKSPTAARPLELLDPLARTIVTHHARTLVVHEPCPNPLQAQILRLLGIPLNPQAAPMITTREFELKASHDLRNVSTKVPPEELRRLEASRRKSR